MDETQKNKIKNFLSDQIMSDSVKKVILDTFLKPSKDRDVQNLAASMIAVERLEEAWKELNRIKGEQRKENRENIQIGL